MYYNLRGKKKIQYLNIFFATNLFFILNKCCSKGGEEGENIYIYISNKMMGENIYIYIYISYNYFLFFFFIKRELFFYFILFFLLISIIIKSFKGFFFFSFILLPQFLLYPSITYIHIYKSKISASIFLNFFFLLYVIHDL